MSDVRRCRTVCEWANIELMRPLRRRGRVCRFRDRLLGGTSLTGKLDIRVRRIYDDPGDEDGVRVLVDRLWPRGVSKVRADIDEWCSAVAPSDALRKWYGHAPERFEEFEARYLNELEDPQRAASVTHLRTVATRGRLTLLTATRDVEASQAAVLAGLLQS